MRWDEMRLKDGDLTSTLDWTAGVESKYLAEDAIMWFQLSTCSNQYDNCFASTSTYSSTIFTLVFLSLLLFNLLIYTTYQRFLSSPLLSSPSPPSHLKPIYSAFSQSIPSPSISLYLILSNLIFSETISSHLTFAWCNNEIRTALRKCDVIHRP